MMISRRVIVRLIRVLQFKNIHNHYSSRTALWFDSFFVWKRMLGIGKHYALTINNNNNSSSVRKITARRSTITLTRRSERPVRRPPLPIDGVGGTTIYWRSSGEKCRRHFQELSSHLHAYTDNHYDLWRPSDPSESSAVACRPAKTVKVPTTKSQNWRRLPEL